MGFGWVLGRFWVGFVWALGGFLWVFCGYWVGFGLVLGWVLGGF